jgi:two-component system, NtrC family, sensor kinase
MRITRQLVLAFLVAMVVIFTTYGWVSHRRTTDYFDAELRREAHTVGHAIGAAVVRIWQEDGREQALRVIDQMNEPGVDTRIRWVWLDGDGKAAVGGEESLPAGEILGAAGGKEVVRRQRSEDGEERLLTYFLLEPEPGRRGALEISESMTRQESFARSSLARTAVTLVVVALVCGGVLTGLGVWLVGRPIRDLVAMARRIGGGDLSVRLAVRRRDEISDLVAEMNRMCDRLAEARERIGAETAARLAMLEQLRHADRLTTVGTLAAGIAHELGSPLQVVLGRAKLIAADGPPAMVPQARAIADQAERMSVIIRQLLDFARRRTLTTATFDVVEVVRQTVSLLAPLARKRDVEIAFREPARALEVDIDAAQIQQVLTNLIMNAVQAGATAEQGRVVVTAGSERAASPPERGGAELDCCWVRIQDQGPGIEPKDLPRIFEPFFTTKDVGEGTGLGLPVAHGIVQEHGGWIAVESEPGRGSAFTIHLPCGAAT